MAGASSIDSHHAPDEPERILGPEDARAYRRFLEWSIGAGFKLAIVEVTAPVRREALVAWTRSSFPEVSLVDLDEATGQPMNTPFDLALSSRPAVSALVLTGLDDAEERIKVCARLNIARDELARDYAVPWVLLVHPATALDLVRHAPDFSDFASLWLREEKGEASELQSTGWLTLSSPSREVSAMDAVEATLGAELLIQAQDAIALSHYDEAEDLLARYDMHRLEARNKNPSRIRLDGLLLEVRGRHAEALVRFKEALRSVEQLPNRRLRAVFLEDIARILADKGEVDQALALHEEALAIFKELGDRHARAVALRDIAHILADKGEVDRALALHEERLQFLEEPDDHRSRAVALGDIARILANKGEVDRALALHKEALAVFEELGDRHSIAGALGDIARIFTYNGKFDRALALHEEALAIFMELGARRARAATLVNIAQILAAGGRLDEALVAYQEGVMVAEEMGDLDLKGYALWVIGRLLRKKGEVQGAQDAFAQAYSLFVRIGRLDLICFVGLDLGTVLFSTNHREQAIPILQRSLDGFLKLGLPDLAQEAQALLDTPP